MKFTYEQAKARADELDAASKAAGAILNAFPKGAMGMTPDDVKARPDYVAAKAAFERAFAAQRNFNRLYTVAFKQERARDRATRIPAATATA